MRGPLRVGDQLLRRIVAAKSEGGGAFTFVPMQIPNANLPVTRQSFAFRLDKNKLREAELRDGHYLLRSNLNGGAHAGSLMCSYPLTPIYAAFHLPENDHFIRDLYLPLTHRDLV